MVIGLASACETLFGQIHGNQNTQLLTIVLQRSIIIFLMLMLPLIGLQLNMENILIHMGQDRLISKLTAEYIILFIPGLVAYAVYIIICRYLQFQVSSKGQLNNYCMRACMHLTPMLTQRTTLLTSQNIQTWPQIPNHIILTILTFLCSFWYTPNALAKHESHQIAIKRDTPISSQQIRYWALALALCIYFVNWVLISKWEY